MVCVSIFILFFGFSDVSCFVVKKYHFFSDLFFLFIGFLKKTQLFFLLAECKLASTLSLALYIDILLGVIIVVCAFQSL